MADRGETTDDGGDEGTEDGEEEVEVVQQEEEEEREDGKWKTEEKPRVVRGLKVWRGGGGASERRRATAGIDARKEEAFASAGAQDVVVDAAEMEEEAAKVAMVYAWKVKRWEQTCLEDQQREHELLSRLEEQTRAAWVAGLASNRIHPVLSTPGGGGWGCSTSGREGEGSQDAKTHGIIVCEGRSDGTVMRADEERHVQSAVAMMAQKEEEMQMQMGNKDEEGNGGGGDSDRAQVRNQGCANATDGVCIETVEADVHTRTETVVTEAKPVCSGEPEAPVVVVEAPKANCNETCRPPPLCVPAPRCAQDDMADEEMVVATAPSAACTPELHSADDVGPSMRVGELGGHLAEPYCILRCFSRALRLSPFPMDSLCAALAAQRRTSLLDNVLTSLLSCLFEDERGWKREKGATSVPPSHGLSRTPVQLLDRITSTAFLIEYLSHGPWKEHAAQAGMNTADQTALGTAVEAMAAIGVQVFHLPLRTKVSLVSLLCRIVLSSSTIKSEVEMRASEGAGNEGSWSASLDQEIAGDASSEYTIGSRVEVLAVSEKGEGCGWHCATVTASEGERICVRYEGSPHFLQGGGQREEWVDIHKRTEVIVYTRRASPLTENGGSSVRYVDMLSTELVSYTRVRPSRCDRVRKWRNGDLVDANVDEMTGWWEGQIVSASTESDTENVAVHFNWDGETRSVPRKRLREALVWHDGRWVHTADYRRRRLDDKPSSPRRSSDENNVERPSPKSVCSTDDPNIDTCAMCRWGGKLVCCDGCPAAFHYTCVGESKQGVQSQAKWYCPECRILPMMLRSGACDAEEAVPLLKKASIGHDSRGRTYWVAHGFLFRREIPMSLCNDKLVRLFRYTGKEAGVIVTELRASGEKADTRLVDILMESGVMVPRSNDDECGIDGGGDDKGRSSDDRYLSHDDRECEMEVYACFHELSAPFMDARDYVNFYENVYSQRPRTRDGPFPEMLHFQWPDPANVEEMKLKLTTFSDTPRKPEPGLGPPSTASTIMAKMLLMEEELYPMLGGEWQLGGRAWRFEWKCDVVAATHPRHLARLLLCLERSLRKILLYSSWSDGFEDGFHEVPVYKFARRGRALPLPRDALRKLARRSCRVVACPELEHEITVCSEVDRALSQRQNEEVGAASKARRSDPALSRSLFVCEPKGGSNEAEPGARVRRKLRCSWIASVEHVSSWSQLALALKILSSHIRWSPLKRQPVPHTSTDVQITARRRARPPSKVRPEDPTDPSIAYEYRADGKWARERQLPLNAIRQYEDKRHRSRRSGDDTNWIPRWYIRSADVRSIVGRPVEVYWEDDKMWYLGQVRSVESTRNNKSLVKIFYNTGEEEILEPKELEDVLHAKALVVLGDRPTEEKTAASLFMEGQPQARADDKFDHQILSLSTSPTQVKRQPKVRPRLLEDDDALAVGTQFDGLENGSPSPTKRRDWRKAKMKISSPAKSKPPKRKREPKKARSAVAGTTDDDFSPIGAAGSDDGGHGAVQQPRVRKNDDFAFGERQMCFTLLSNLRQWCDGQGRRVALQFDRLPSRGVDAAYYKVIKNPIDLQSIETALRKGGRKRAYRGVKDLVRDVYIMLENAEYYNSESSQIYADVSITRNAFIGMVCDSFPNFQMKELMPSALTPSEEEVDGGSPSPCTDAADAEEILRGWSHKGKFLSVYWADDEAYYRGQIKVFDEVNRTHLIRYDDGEYEWLNLATEKVKWLDASTAKDKDNGCMIAAPVAEAAAVAVMTATTATRRGTNDRSDAGVNAQLLSSRETRAANPSKRAVARVESDSGGDDHDDTVSRVGKKRRRVASSTSCAIANGRVDPKTPVANGRVGLRRANGVTRSTSAMTHKHSSGPNGVRRYQRHRSKEEEEDEDEEEGNHDTHGNGNSTGIEKFGRRVVQPPKNCATSNGDAFSKNATTEVTTTRSRGTTRLTRSVKEETALRAAASVVIKDKPPKRTELVLNPSAAGASLIDRRIQIYWDGDDEWFAGTLTWFNPRTKRHTISYDDGEHATLKLEEEVYEFMDT